MIEIDNQLCYSPRPPEAYGVGPVGHGPMAQGDIQLWNLMYLSYPRLDGYADCTTDEEKVAHYKTFPISDIANCRVAINSDTGKRLAPGLRGALRRTPHMFLEDLWRMQWEFLPMHLGDPQWVETIQVRAKEIDAEQRVERVAAVTHRIGNVVNVRFGGRG